MSIQEYQQLRILPSIDQTLDKYEDILNRGYNPHLKCDDVTFYMAVKSALSNEWFMHGPKNSIAFIFRLLDLSYSICGADGYQMFKYIMKFGTTDDIVKFLKYGFDLGKYPHLIFKTIFWNPEALGILIEAGMRINVVNEDGDDPLIASIKQLNAYGERTCLDLPPIMSCSEMIHYFEMDDCQYEVFDELNLDSDLDGQIRALHELKRYMDLPITKKANRYP